jgi:spermidine synthase
VQDVCVFESESIFKRVLTLDGVIQLTQHDEFSYQEMITHLPLCGVSSAPERVLIVGGGDGGVLREVAKHESVKHIDMVEIDAMVPEVSKQFFPEMAVAFGDARLNLVIDDGLKWLEACEEATYDAIIVDSSDPVGPAEVLFEERFFRLMFRALKPGGALCTQAESLWLHMPIIESLARTCSAIFEEGSVHYAYTTIPTYPSGQIGFMICCKQGGKGAHDMREPQREVPAELCKYYHAAIHRAAFVLPHFALRKLSKFLTFQ